MDSIWLCKDSEAIQLLIQQRRPSNMPQVVSVSLPEYVMCFQGSVLMPLNCPCRLRQHPLLHNTSFGYRIKDISHCIKNLIPLMLLIESVVLSLTSICYKTKAAFTPFALFWNMWFVPKHFAYFCWVVLWSHYIIVKWAKANTLSSVSSRPYFTASSTPVALRIVGYFHESDSNEMSRG